MEKVLKGYVFRMYPNQKQIELIEKSFGISRYIYNYFLNKNQNKKYFNPFNHIKELPSLCSENKWLKEVDSCLLRCAIFNLEDSYKRYNNKLGEYPKFKGKHTSRNSYRTNNITSTYIGKTYNSITLDLKNKIIKLPKLKEIKIRGYRNLNNIIGRIINACIYKEANKYYVSVCIEEEKTIEKIIPKTIAGIDLGIKEIAVTSDGRVYNNRKIIEKYENKIKGLNRWLNRAKPGSKNRYKIKIKLQTTYQKLKNARKYYLHKISKEITKENDIIVTENLKTKEMVQNQNLSKKILDVSWNELIRQIKYKSKWQGKTTYQIETYYPSSQICSHCEYQNKETKDLKIREWICPECRNVNDRDINASINIMYEGIKKYMKEIAKFQEV